MKTVVTSVSRHARLGMVAAVAAGAGLWGAAPAMAHDAVVGGTITEGETVEEFPREITLDFSGVPKEGFNTFAVTDVDSGEVLFSEEPTLEGQSLTVETPGDVDPGPGDYKVGFLITSSDGHATRGTVSFTVDDGSAAAAGGQSDGISESDSAAADSDSAQQTEGEAESSAPAEPLSGMEGPMKWVIAIGGILAAVAVIVMLVSKRR